MTDTNPAEVERVGSLLRDAISRHPERRLADLKFGIGTEASSGKVLYTWNWEGSCPMGMLLYGTECHYDPVEDAARILGIEVHELSAICRGFDRVLPVSNTVWYWLGHILRKEANFRKDVENDKGVHDRNLG
mgnify:CR=1 FL=1